MMLLELFCWLLLWVFPRAADSNTILDWGGIGIIAAKAFGFWLVCTVIGILIAPRPD